jgi:hypothetical protein
MSELPVIYTAFPNRIYEIEMHGSLFYWPDDWPLDKEIVCIECTFTRVSKDKNVSIRTELEAENESKARETGLNRCRVESEIFAFSSDTMLILDSTNIRVKEKTSQLATGFASVSTNAIIAPHVDLTAEQLISALSIVQENFRKSDSLVGLKRAIHWYTLAKLEKESKIDKFIKYWIALEVLTDKEKGNDVQQVKNALKTAYPEIEGRIEQDGIIGRCIYALRKEIFHEGKRRSDELNDSQLDINVQLKQIEAILKDLLRYEMGLSRRDFAKQYFT